jgi:L-asparaginase
MDSSRRDFLKWCGAGVTAAAVGSLAQCSLLRQESETAVTASPTATIPNPTVKSIVKPTIYIAYTGGTIGMNKTQGGYAPAPGYLAQRMAAMPELRDPAMPAYTIHEYDPLLDSSNMTPDDWLKIAQDVAANYDRFDGFIVLHGTDTMAYTASALSFMLQGLGKPVILTGSQIPLCELRNDARENLITALIVAASYPVPEVCLYFGSKLLRGCRATKVNADGFEAFDSPNYPPLGIVGVDIEIDWDLVRPAAPAATLTVQAFQEPVVGALRLFPGISAPMVSNILRSPLQGLVLEAYGVGNGPDRDQAFIAVLQEATDRGVVIVDCTQCLRGTVNLGDYATGSALARAGVISGADMTAEAALTKLFYLFSRGLGPDEVKREMVRNLRGELTPGRQERA